MSETPLADRYRDEVKLCRREHRAHWVVVTRNANYRAFNGHRYQPSNYSQVNCRACRRAWCSTKAAYVDSLPDA